MKDLGFIISQIRVMKEQERAEAYRCTNYLRYRTELSPANRQALCNWGYGTIAKCHGANRLTVVKAISYFDRYMGISSQSRDLHTIQLAFIASLVIALKVEAGFSVELDFVASAITKGTYGKEEIVSMEFEILKALEWRLNGPTPHEFIDRFLELIPGVGSAQSELLNRLSKAIAEEAATTYSFALRYPSVVAFGAICCGLEYLKSFFEIDSLAIQHSLQIVSGLKCKGPLLKLSIEAVHRFIPDSALGHFSSFVETVEEDSRSFSSVDSPKSVFDM